MAHNPFTGLWRLLEDLGCLITYLEIGSYVAQTDFELLIPHPTPQPAPWVQSLQAALSHVHTTQRHTHTVLLKFASIWLFSSNLKTPPVLFSLPALSVDPGRGIEDLY